jgi:hypothetical protein
VGTTYSMAGKMTLAVQYGMLPAPGVNGNMSLALSAAQSLLTVTPSLPTLEISRRVVQPNCPKPLMALLQLPLTGSHAVAVLPWDVGQDDEGAAAEMEVATGLVEWQYKGFQVGGAGKAWWNEEEGHGLDMEQVGTLMLTACAMPCPFFEFTWEEQHTVSSCDGYAVFYVC